MDFSVSNLTYDANGNIKTLWQKGRNITGSDFIDKLSYDYGLGTGNELRNKLFKVSDNINSAQSKLGDFKDGTNGGDDYDYDANGNLKLDNNKSISSIAYNHMNLPATVNVTGNGTVNYIYDAGGNKLKKITTDNTLAGKTVTTTTTYIGGMVYESRQTSPAAPDDYSDKLQFISTEEGRVRLTTNINNPFAYDYFVKDHLGNVRMVLTDEEKQNIYPAATLEGSLTTDGIPNAAFKEKDYYSIDGNYVVPKADATGITDYYNKNGEPAALDPPVNNNPNSDVTANSEKLYKLNAATNKTGLGITLKVMAGDQVNIFGRSYWFNSGGNFNDKFPIPVLGLLDAFLASPSMAAKGIAAATLNTTPFADAASAYLQRSDNPGYLAPWAYINWVLFDEQFNYVSGGADRIGASGVVKVHDNTTIPSIPVTKNGYIFVYCSNESNYSVYFDNLQLVHTQGALLEETHYYPFGLTMAGISSKALGFGNPENKIKFQGQEFATKEFSDGSGLEMYEFKWRMHDPQIGRFWQVDPLSDKYVYNSTYAFSENKVTAHIELEGLEAKLAIAGNGNNTSYKPDDIQAFDDRAKNLEKKAGFTASQVNNGNQVVNKLKEGTKKEGSVGAVVIFAHASQEGVYLDKNDGLYRGNEWHGGTNSANITAIKAAVDRGEIKFDENAVFVMGACNCGKNDGKASLAETMAQELGVTVYAATGPVYPEVINGRETGRLQTNGTFNMYRMTGEVTIDIPGYGSMTFPAGVGKTNVGSTIDPAKLTSQKSR